MKIYLNLDHRTEAFAFKKDHVDELHSVFPALDPVPVHSTKELAAKVEDAEFVATWRFPTELYERAPNLRAVFTPAAGREWVAPDPMGRVPTFYGTFHGMLMAESLLSMVLYFNRRLGALIENKQKGIWSREGMSECRSLSVQRVLIVGYGNIGKACARVLAALGCNIVGVRRRPEDAEPDPNVHRLVRFDEVGPDLERADHVVFALPGGPETDHLVTREHFRRMKPTAIVYNLGRGNCYLEDDLVWALQSGVIAGAGLDVFAEEPLPEASSLWKLQNVFIMPHSSAVYDDYMDLFLAEMMGRLHRLLPRAGR